MALIICKHCGKSISDTSEVCIHCGMSIAAFEHEVPDEPTVNGDEPFEKKHQDIFTDYEMYSEEKRLEFEKEFIESDEWAKKYKRTRIEIPQFNRVACFGFVLPIIPFIILGKSSDIIANLDHLTGTPAIIFVLAIICTIVNIVIWIATLICVSAIKIKHKIYNSKYIYMKKFQSWLKENKSIDYTPPFTRMKEQRIFDSIDLGSLQK